MSIGLSSSLSGRKNTILVYGFEWEVVLMYPDFNVGFPMQNLQMVAGLLMYNNVTGMNVNYHDMISRYIAQA